ncbi:MAG: caspase family protein, partial [Desulfobaccales bacterium]
MTTEMIYQPKYTNSHALIIGINAYRKAPPLGYARNDAESIASILNDKFEFPETNVALLVDDQATKEQILGTFLEYTKEQFGPDDRIIVFFAGHGYTKPGKRGEVGFLVPVDGTPDDLSTLIRWDDLTRNSELIDAKHILFVMDACYGGLALTRHMSPGSMRFAKDMLQRYSRQVLTAGKANEVVADSG